MDRKQWDDREKAKQERIERNLTARAARTPQQQLDRLDKLLGKGVGANKERARLLKEIEG